MKTDGNEPAFSMPFSRIHVAQEGWTGNHEHYGLTKREYFAAMAMQGCIEKSDSPVLKKPEEWLEEPSRIAQWAVLYADALITELNKTK